MASLLIHDNETKEQGSLTIFSVKLMGRELEIDVSGNESGVFVKGYDVNGFRPVCLSMLASRLVLCQVVPLVHVEAKSPWFRRQSSSNDMNPP